jgi:hypothetical protein
MKNLTVESIRVSQSETKSLDYINLAEKLTMRAYELAGSSSFLGRFVSEMELLCQSIKYRDNEFSIYKDSLAVEVWYNKIEGVKTGKLTMRDLI